MQLLITHVTHLTYSAPVTEEVMECRLGPLWDDDQRWHRFELRARPGGLIRAYFDAFGNPSHLVTLAAPHEHLELTMEGEVVTLLADPFEVPRVSPRPLSSLERFDYLHPSQLIPADPRLRDLAAACVTDPAGEPFEAALALASLVHERFTYTPDATTTATTVSDALDCRAGVCQDFAHVLIGLCRAVGLPARYVSGYLLAERHDGATEGPGESGTSEPYGVGRDRRGGGDQGDGRSEEGRPGQGDDHGASASHAWAEVFSPSHGWRGFDPTNNVLASEHHVKMAVGRDYADVPPTRGTFRGVATSELSVDVSVRPAD